MPDPLLYLAAIAAAALAAALLVAAILWMSRANPGKNATSTRANVATVVGMAGGLIAGYWVLDLYLSWPPVNALDRLLTIVLPLAVGSELVAAFEKVPRWLAWTLRMVLVAVMGRILLHGSVYLTSAHSTWAIGVQLATCAALTAGLWGCAAAWADRGPRRIPLATALALTMIFAGGLILFSGYVSGGAATLPLSAALVATVVTSSLLTRGANVQAPIGIGVVGLSGLLFIGHYFGGLSSGVAAALLLAPLLGWMPEMLRRNHRGRFRAR
jgi:hypothetical protein